LREIGEADLPTLHEWRNDTRFTDYCSTRRNKVSFEEFKKELSRDFNRDRHLQCIIVRNDRPIGTIYAYGLNKTDGYVFITTYLTSDCERAGYGAEAFALFMLYLFQNLHLFKIYAEVYSYNEHPLSCLKNAGFIEEGRFRGHRLHNGERCDLTRLAFFREELPRLEKFVERLTGKIEMIPEKISVPDILDETINLFREKVTQHNVVIKNEHDTELNFIEADRKRLKQILFNLLSNAVKYSKPEGGIVTIITKKKGDLAKFSVSDTGIGIKEEDMKKLFSAFEQLDLGIASKYGSTGLGLVVTKKLVELQGGRITAESKYGYGSTFTVTLPVPAGVVAVI